MKASNCELRDDTDKLFDNLKKHEVPILVLSAGCGDLVDAIMEHYKINNDNVKTVSNFIEFDNSGKIVGLFPPMIHMFNKSENAIHDSDYFKELKKRTNVSKRCHKVEIYLWTSLCAGCPNGRFSERPSHG